MKNVEIIWEDRSLLLVNKPAGLNADIDKFNHPSVEGWAKEYLKNKPVFLYNRIDRPSSGLMVLVKKKTALLKLTSGEAGNIRKTYRALSSEKPAKDQAELVNHVYKDLKNKRLLVYDQEGDRLRKEARLRYKLMKEHTNCTEFSIELITGRYHQVRAQFSHIGCPLLGDKTYGSEVDFGENKIGLHAWKLQFRHPVTDKYLEIEAPLPEYWPQ